MWFHPSGLSVRVTENAIGAGLDLACVWQASWTQRGWALVFSMETHRWGSCDSREAPQHRINSSAVARPGLSCYPTIPYSQDAPYRSVINMTWHSSLSLITGCGGHVLCLLCLPTSQLQAFFGVCNLSSPQSHTHLGLPGRAVAEIAATPLPLRTGWETPWCGRAEITAKGENTGGVSGPLHTWTTRGLCELAVLHLISFCFFCFINTLFLHIVLWVSGYWYAVLCILSGAVRMWFLIVR